MQSTEDKWIVTIHGTDGRVTENYFVYGTEAQVRTHMMGLVEAEKQNGKHFSHATDGEDNIEEFDEMLYAYASFEKYTVDITAIPEQACKCIHLE